MFFHYDCVSFLAVKMLKVNTAFKKSSTLREISGENQ